MAHFTIYRWEFDYLAFHTPEEITAVLVDGDIRPNREFQQEDEIEVGDSITIYEDRAYTRWDDYLIVDVWREPAAKVTVFHGSSISIARSGG